MKQASLIQLSIFFLTLLSTKCVQAANPPAAPAPVPKNPGSSGGKTGSSSNTGRGVNNLVATMGQVQEGNCGGNTMSFPSQNSWGKVVLAQYVILYQNIWKADQVLSTGKSDVTCTSFKQGNLAWVNTFNLPCNAQNDKQVKAYNNVAWGGNPIAINSVQAFSSTWNWELKTSGGLVADVSYDLFLSKNRGCRSQDCSTTEVMLWLAAIGGARPAGSRVPVKGNPTGVINIAGKSFQVWKGVVGMPVISIFPADPEKTYTSFKADLKAVLQSLSEFGVNSSDSIVSVGAGIEIFKGQGTLKTSQYTLNLY